MLAPEPPQGSAGTATLGGSVELSTKTEEIWITRLLDEYKILQDKIDKIGGFRFTVKGWSVTLTTAALAASTAAKAPALLPLLLLPIIVVFFLLEHQQWEHSRRFQIRATRIEAQLREYRRNPSHDLSDFDIPGLASELSHRRRQIPIVRLIRSRLVLSLTHVDWWIYWVQAFFVFVVTIWLLARPGSGGSSGPVTIIKTGGSELRSSPSNGQPRRTDDAETLP